MFFRCSWLSGVERFHQIFGVNPDHISPAAIQGLVRDGLLQPTKSPHYFRSARLQLPREGSKAGNKHLRTEADVVNWKLEIEKLQKGLSFKTGAQTIGSNSPRQQSLLDRHQSRRTVEKITPAVSLRDTPANEEHATSAFAEVNSFLRRTHQRVKPKAQSASRTYNELFATQRNSRDQQRGTQTPAHA